MVSTASLLGARHLWEVVENKPASSLIVFLGKALNGTPPPLCGRQVVQTPQKMATPKRVRTSRPKYSDTIHFLVNMIKWRINMNKYKIQRTGVLQRNFSMLVTKSHLIIRLSSLMLSPQTKTVAKRASSPVAGL